MTTKQYLRKKLNETKTCKICGEAITHDNHATIDHIWPKSKGGINHLLNYRFICVRCNLRKGDNYPTVPEVKQLYGATVSALKRLINAKTFNKEYREILKFKRHLFKWTLKKDKDIVT